MSGQQQELPDSPASVPASSASRQARAVPAPFRPPSPPPPPPPFKSASRRRTRCIGAASRSARLGLWAPVQGVKRARGSGAGSDTASGAEFDGDGVDTDAERAAAQACAARTSRLERGWWEKRYRTYRGGKECGDIIARFLLLPTTSISMGVSPRSSPISSFYLGCDSAASGFISRSAAITLNHGRLEFMAPAETGSSAIRETGKTSGGMNGGI
ncbi:hypothetical protein DFH09DRAFT_1108553 [Mycena vulgaris]|nr:hypothetical protein DFH09DRAFT_1108553 [Mycena vulgaris]